MAVLKWDAVGERLYETGTDHGVLFLADTTGATDYQPGVSWTGLMKVTESPDGAEETALYADNIKYLSLFSSENFKGTIGAYTYPDEFAMANGEIELKTGITVHEQTRVPFAFSYRTKIGNDLENEDYGYKIHIVYGAKVQPSEKSYESVNSDPSALEMEWDFVTSPVEVPGYKPTAHIAIDSTKVTPENMKKIEDALYGTADKEPGVLMPADLVALVGTI